MGPRPIPRELLALIASAGNDLERAADFIEEYIIHRRNKGDSLYDVSNSLVELEAKVPARSAPAIRQAQYATNVPPASDLSPPSGSLHHSSSSTQTVLAYLISDPPPDIHRAREVILEFVLARETRFRDKKHGPGGKGTLGRDGFEEIAARLGEIEDGLRGKGPLVSPTARRAGTATPAQGTPDDELPPTRQLGLTLVLSLRMLLSYFSLVDLGRQLLSQTPQDAVRTLVQHIRRRVPGEGRFNVGRELEYVESLTLHRRPTLRPAFRSARERTCLPQRSLYPVSLPAPSKSACIKLLNAFIRDVDLAGLSAASSYMQPSTHGQAPVPATARKKTSPLIGGVPGSPVSPSLSPNGSPIRGGGSNVPLPTDTTPVENYTLELISEWLTREKREYMLKNKWAKAGREQLSKDLFDIESATCVSHKGTPTSHSSGLLPVFLLLRRTFSLPATPLSNAIIGSAYEMLPMPPEPDAVPLPEPTVSSTTAALYVNPRLSDRDALDLVEELLESEREKGINAAVSKEKTVAWLLGQVDHVQKRFPDGSYETVFEQARMLASHPRSWPDVSTSSAFPAHPLVNGAGHRRSKSSAITSPAKEDFRDVPAIPSVFGASPVSAKSHMRSASMPFRTSGHSELSAPHSTKDSVSPALSSQAVRDSESSANDAGSGSDRDSNVHRRAPPPPVDSLGLSNHGYSNHFDHGHAEMQPKKSASGGRDRSNTTTSIPNHNRDQSVNHNTRERSATTTFSSSRERNLAEARERFNARANTIRTKAPPQLSLNVTSYQISTELSDFMEAAPQSATSVATPASASSVAASSESGWWDHVSAVDPNSPAPRRPSPFLGNDSRRGSEPPESPLVACNPPVVQPASLPPGAGTPLLDGAALQVLGTMSEAASSETVTPSTAIPTAAESPSSPLGLNLNLRHPTGAEKLPSSFSSMPAGPSRNAPPPLSLAEVEHAAAAAAAIAAAEAKLTGSAPSSASNTPQTTPKLPSSARVEGPPGMAHFAPEVEELDDAVAPKVTTPKSAPLTTSRPPWSAVTSPVDPPAIQRSQQGSISRSGSGRPPPVPTTIDRPGFPSRSGAPPSSTRDVVSPAEHTTKSKLGSFGRSMSIGARHVMGRSKDKQIEKEAIREQASLARKGTMMAGRPANNPERWNRDMVSALMGPPVERR